MKLVMNPIKQHRGFTLVLCMVMAAPTNGWAGNPSLSDDLANITQWLSDQTATGFAFNGGATVSPPTELGAGGLEWDASFGAGLVPLDVKAFPTVGVDQLNDAGIQSFFPSAIPFPHFTAHLRVGLPNRTDLAARFSNLTAPTYSVSERTKASGQSNIYGVELRRHFLGTGDAMPRISVTGMLTLLKGSFIFNNRFENQKLTDTFYVDSDNSGFLKWNMVTYGANAVMSKAYGRWTPFGGLGYSYSAGTVQTEMTAEFKTPLIQPSRGQASAKPREHAVRALFGATRKLRKMSLLFNGEVMLVGGPKGLPNMNFHVGVTAPLRWGKSYYTERGEKASLRPVAHEPKVEQRASGVEPAKRRMRSRTRRYRTKSAVKSEAPKRASAPKSPAPAPVRRSDLIFIH